jgi:hypothetical protein
MYVCEKLFVKSGEVNYCKLLCEIIKTRKQIPEYAEKCGHRIFKSKG